MTTIWNDGVFDLEVDVAGVIERDGRTWEVGSVSWQHDSYLLVFRETAHPESYFFAAHRSIENRMSTVGLEPMVVHTQHSLALWRATLALSFKQKAWGRLLWFDARLQTASLADAHWQLFFLADGRTAWTTQHKYYHGSIAVSPFSRDNAPWGNAPTKAWLEWTQDALQQPTDCRFALDFANLSMEDEIRCAVSWKYGDYDQFERVCGYIGQIAVDWNEPWDGKHLSLIALLSLSSETPSDFLFSSDTRKRFPTLPDSRLTERLCSWAVRIAAPYIKEEMLQRACIQHWLKTSLFLATASIEPPNAHQRLEAVASLREWARGAGKEDELLALLESANFQHED